jgi:hypothetical protein
VLRANLLIFEQLLPPPSNSFIFNRHIPSFGKTTAESDFARTASCVC